MRGNIDAPVEQIPDALTIELAVPDRAATRVWRRLNGASFWRVVAGDAAFRHEKERASDFQSSANDSH